MANYVEYIKVGPGEAWPVRDKEAQDKFNNLVDLVYPVGSIYMSVSPTSPDTLFGGTWERIQDRFLLAAGSSYAAGSTGGEAAHTLTDPEMPMHIHGITQLHISKHEGSTEQNTHRSIPYVDTWWYSGKEGDTLPYNLGHIDAAGGNQPHNNMPPYLTVYMWRRES